MDYQRHYEAEAYKVHVCNIILDDGMEVLGETFIYAGEQKVGKGGHFRPKGLAVKATR